MASPPTQQSVDLFLGPTASNWTLLNATNVSSAPPFDWRPIEVPELPLSTLFNIQGVCRNCQEDEFGTFQLFDDAFVRRILQQQAGADFTVGNVSDETCSCPVGVEPSSKGPSVEQVQQRYFARVAQLEGAGQLGSVKALGDVILEGQQVSCSSNANLFKSFVYATLMVRKKPIASLSPTSVLAMDVCG